MKVAILTHLEKETTREHDAVVAQVAGALRKGRHKPSVLGVHGDARKLIGGLRRRKPDLVFNLMETFGDTQLGAVGVVGLLDLLGIPYTGDGPGEFYLQEDKALAKKLLAYDKIRCPDFAVFSQDADFETGGNLRPPLFVKPLRMDASIGIDAGSLVHTSVELMDRVRMIQEKVHDSALAEEYIEGREFYVGVLGNGEPLAFPPVEMDFSGLPVGAPHILDSKAKWDEDSPEFQGTKAVMPTLPDELRETAKGGHRRLPGAAGARLRPRGPAPDRVGRGLRHRGERQLLPGGVGRVRDCRRRRGHRVRRPGQPHRGAGSGAPAGSPTTTGDTAGSRSLPVSPPVDVVHRQRRHQRGQSHRRLGFAPGRIGQFQLLGPPRQVTQQLPRPLGKVAGPAVDVRRQRLLQPADQRRGGFRRDPVLEDRRSAPSSPGGNSSAAASAR